MAISCGGRCKITPPARRKTPLRRDMRQGWIYAKKFEKTVVLDVKRRELNVVWSLVSRVAETSCLFDKRLAEMPWGRYFLYVGSVLLAMLFVADEYFSPSVEAQPHAAGGVDKSIIRIASTHRWPERIVIDTSIPTIIPPPLTAYAENVAASNPTREAFAQVTTPHPKVADATPAREKRKIAKYRSPKPIEPYRTAIVGVPSFFGTW